MLKSPTWWETQYGTDYTSGNRKLWKDLEEGIIREGARENVTNDKYRINNPIEE